MTVAAVKCSAASPSKCRSLIRKAYFPEESAANAPVFVAVPIHMNGRIYDPHLGRMLQADPFIQFPTNTQSYNRYSYVLNNPLNATDPTGHFVFTAAAMIAVATKTVVAVEAVVGAFALAGFADTLAAGGSFNQALKNGLIAGVSAYAFSAVGASDVFGYAPGDGFGQLAINSAANGVTGGIMNVLGGEKFGHGFASAGLTAFAKPGIHKAFGTGTNGLPARVVARSILGGTISKMTGGKFANGAITAAFSQLLNDEATLDALNSNNDGLTGGFSPASGDYLSTSGDVVGLSVNENGALYDASGEFYALNTDGTVNVLASGAIDGVYPETLIGGGRMLVAGGYKAISFATGRMSPTYASFAKGSAARNYWKVATFGKAFRLRSKPPAFYWQRAGGNFGKAVQSLGHSNRAWNMRLMPLAPVGLSGEASN